MAHLIVLSPNSTMAQKLDLVLKVNQLGYSVRVGHNNEKQNGYRVFKDGQRAELDQADKAYLLTQPAVEVIEDSS